MGEEEIKEKMVNKIIRTLKIGKEGLVIGAIGGWITSLILPKLGVTTLIFSTASIETGAFQLEPIQPAMWVLIMVGAIIGFNVDIFITKNIKLRRFLK